MNSVARSLRLVLVGQWRVIVAVTVLVTALIGTSAWLMTPIYRSEVVMVPQSRAADEASLRNIGGAIGGLGSLFGLVGGGDANTEYALAVLKSTSLSSKFIQDNDLLKVIFESDWDDSHKSWKDSSPGEAPTILDGVREFDEEIRTVITDPKAGIVKLRIDWTDPAEAAKWANSLVALLNETVRARTISEARERIAFLNRELAKTQVIELRAALSRVLESELKREMLATVTEDYAFKVLDPAIPADVDDPVTPNRPLMLVVGLLIGLSLGVGVALIRRSAA